MAIRCTGAQFPQDIMVMGVRGYVADPLSSRHVEARMEARGVLLDQATIQRWVVQDSPLLAEALHRRKRPGWGRWRLDETSMHGQGQWRYWSRAVAKPGQPRDVLLTAQRDEAAALRFLKKAIRRQGIPEKSTL